MRKEETQRCNWKQRFNSLSQKAMKKESKKKKTKKMQEKEIILKRRKHIYIYKHIIEKIN